RLDMDTSGVMVVALTPEAYGSLQRQFLRHEIKKKYLAWLECPMVSGQEGDISLPLRPDLADRPRQLVDQEHGKSAITHYRVLENRKGHALVALWPQTGRTHQLRVHCAHPLGLNNPIVGDRLYGKPAERLMLHAQEVEFTHPTDGKAMKFVLPLEF
ncbi:MAG: RluA family pseudouridine synthase, partial [Bacteroidaceae bacterium]|nr:RluA family pseudouridine synthase [Bacteroidaceae bacterium]